MADLLATGASTLVGAAILAMLVREVFAQLFHPEGRDTLGRATFRAARAVARRFPRMHVHAGPLALVAVLWSWVFLAVIGWMLLILPHVPEAVTYGSGVSRFHPLVDAAYLSLVGISTLGYGDIVPDSALLRLVWPLEAAMGFGIITAGLAWTLGIVGPLGRQRTLARQANLILEDEATCAATLRDLASEVVAATIDLKLAPPTYYMAPSAPRESLPLVVTALWDLAESLVDAPEAEVAVAARRLRRALDEFGEQVADTHLAELCDVTGRDRLVRYRVDCEPVREPRELGPRPAVTRS